VYYGVDSLPMTPEELETMCLEEIPQGTWKALP